MKKIILGSMLFAIISNIYSQELSPGKKYTYKQNSKRLLTLSFVNDSICSITNKFINLGGESDKIEYTCKYKILSNDYLLLMNNGGNVDSLKNGFFIFPERFIDTLAAFEKRRKSAPTAPNYSPSIYKYLKVPYVDYDTLMRYKKTIGWLKKDGTNKVVGYYKFNLSAAN